MHIDYMTTGDINGQPIAFRQYNQLLPNSPVQLTGWHLKRLESYFFKFLVLNHFNSMLI